MRWLRRGDSGLSLPLFALAHVGIFAGLFRGLYSIPFSGTALYYDYAGKTLSGLLPYRDFVLEYPPLALGIFTLPRLLGESFRWYYVFFQTEVIIADLVILGALWFAARRSAMSPTRVLIAYTIGVLAVGPITLHQFDIFSAAFTILAVIALAREKSVLAAFWLALGVATKIYPILLAPLFVLVEWKRGRINQIGFAIGAFIATGTLTVLPWLLRAPKSLLVMINYHKDRGIHLDSTWASVAFILRAMKLTWVNVQLQFQSWQIGGPATDALIPISSLVLLGVLALSYWWIYRSMESKVTIDLVFLARASVFVLLGAMAASKVFSPQYLFWPVPFLALLDLQGERLVHGLFVLVGLITYWVYPFHYPQLIDRYPLPITAFIIRNALVALLAVLLARRMHNPYETL
jgi:hypothetical protein